VRVYRSMHMVDACLCVYIWISFVVSLLSGLGRVNAPLVLPLQNPIWALATLESRLLLMHNLLLRLYCLGSLLLLLLECQDLLNILPEVELSLSPLVRTVLLLLLCIPWLPCRLRQVGLFEVLRVANCVVLWILVALLLLRLQIFLYNHAWASSCMLACLVRFLTEIVGLLFDNLMRLIHVNSICPAIRRLHPDSVHGVTELFVRTWISTFLLLTVHWILAHHHLL